MKKFIKLTAFMIFTIYLLITGYGNVTHAESETDFEYSHEEILEMMENGRKNIEEKLLKSNFDIQNYKTSSEYINEYKKIQNNYKSSYSQWDRMMYDIERFFDYIQANPTTTFFYVLIFIIFIFSLNISEINKKDENDKLKEKRGSLSEKEKNFLKQTTKGQAATRFTILLPIVSCIRHKRWGMLILCIFEWLLIMFCFDLSGDLSFSDNPTNLLIIGGILIRIMTTKDIIGIKYNEGYFRETIKEYRKKNGSDTKEPKEIIKKETKSKSKKIVIWIIILILVILIYPTLIIIDSGKNNSKDEYKTTKKEKEVEEIKKSDEEILNENIEKLTDEFENKIYYILGDLAVEDKNFKEVAVIEKAITNGKLAKEYVNEYIIKLDKLIDDYESNGNIYNGKGRVNTSKEIIKSLEDLINANIERLEYILSIQNSFFIKSDGTLMFYDSKTLKKYNELVKKHNEATKAFQKIIEENS